jgi:hypothetical protein
VSRPVHPRVTAAAVVAGLVLTLAGCADDDPEPDSGKSASPSVSASGPSATASSASPSEAATPTVPAATGPLLKMPNATINAPNGWTKSSHIADFITEANPPRGHTSLGLASLQYVGPTAPLDVLAKSAIKTYSEDRRLKRLPDVEIAGVPFYHVGGKPSSYNYIDHFGVRYQGYDTDVHFDFDKTVSAAEREKIIAESLASFTWR